MTFFKLWVCVLLGAIGGLIEAQGGWVVFGVACVLYFIALKLGQRWMRAA